MLVDGKVFIAFLKHLTKYFFHNSDLQLTLNIYEYTEKTSDNQLERIKCKENCGVHRL